MTENRQFYVVDLGKMANDQTSLSIDLNTRIERLVPRGREVHFLQAVSHDGHMFVFLRALDGKKPAK